MYWARGLKADGFRKDRGPTTPKNKPDNACYAKDKTNAHLAEMITRMTRWKLFYVMAGPRYIAFMQ